MRPSSVKLVFPVDIDYYEALLRYENAYSLGIAIDLLFETKCSSTFRKFDGHGDIDRAGIIYLTYISYKFKGLIHSGNYFTKIFKIIPFGARKFSHYRPLCPQELFNVNYDARFTSHMIQNSNIVAVFEDDE